MHCERLSCKTEDFFEYHVNKQACFSFSLKCSHFIARVHLPRHKPYFPQHYFTEAR